MAILGALVFHKHVLFSLPQCFNQYYNFTNFLLLSQSQKPITVELFDPFDDKEDALVYQSVIDSGHVRLALKPVTSPRLIFGSCTSNFLLNQVKFV